MHLEWGAPLAFTFDKSYWTNGENVQPTGIELIMGQRNKNNVVRFRAKGAVPPTPKVHCPGADVERPIPVGQRGGGGRHQAVRRGRARQRHRRDRSRERRGGRADQSRAQPARAHALAPGVKERSISLEEAAQIAARVGLPVP